MWEKKPVPELSRFFGIIIRMYLEAGEGHHTPHFHAYYQDNVAVYGIEPVDLISGGLPRRQQRMLRRGRKCIRPSYRPTGNVCRQARSPYRYNH